MVATAEGIRNCWTRDAALASNVGGAGEFGFYGHRFIIKVRVAELTPPARVAWDEVSSAGGGFDGTTISFDLKSDEGITSLLLRIADSRRMATISPPQRHVGASIS
jgi:hypothetical protein